MNVNVLKWSVVFYGELVMYFNLLSIIKCEEFII